MFTGAVLWCRHVTERMPDPEAFVAGADTPYLFVFTSN